MTNQYTSQLTAERAIAVKLLSRGQVTIIEIANHFKLNRQLVAHWAKGIDVAKRRAEWVAKAVKRVSK